jgi:proton-dependent oligopeptide transporter, POT family
VYCVGCLALALDDSRLGLTVGLGLIAIGSGGIKPCVSANVGDQFGPANQHLLQKVFSWFYASINFGSFFSTLLTPWLLDRYGPRWAFGVPGVFMLLATAVFWLGRHRFVRVPPAGLGFVRETLSAEGLRTVAKLVPVFLMILVFWALWDQTGSAWVLQAEKMDRKLFGFEILSSQVQAANPALILALIPVCSFVIYPAINRVFPLTSLRKIGLGLFLAVPSFLIPAWIEGQIARGLQPSIGWQLLAFVVISLAEIMVSINALEFSYTQAPPKMKSLIMSLYLMSIALGNLSTSLFNLVMRNPDGTAKFQGAAYFNIFAGLMFVAAVLFIFIAALYREKNYLQAPVSANG